MAVCPIGVVGCGAVWWFKRDASCPRISQFCGKMRTDDFSFCWSLGKCKWFSYVSCSSHSVRTSMAHMMKSFLDMRSTNRPLLMRQAARNGKPARLVWPCVSIRGLVTEFLSHLFSDMNWYNIAYCHSTVIHSKSFSRYFHLVSFGNFHAGRIQRFWIGPASWELWICWFWSLFWKGGEYFPLKPDGTPGSCGQKNQPLTSKYDSLPHGN